MDTRSLCRKLAPALLVAVGFVIVPARPGAGQDRVTIRGQVLDLVTHTPINGAFVARMGSNQGVLTDSLGNFALSQLADWSYPVSVENLGYETVSLVLPSTAPNEFATIFLRPDPIALEGITVLVDRFERRRRTYFGPVTVIDQERIADGPAESVFDLMRRSIPFARFCGQAMEELCTIRRGRQVRVGVCIDERPAFAGARELEGWDARELYMMEIYDRGRQVRVYSRWFVDRLVREGKGLMPLTFGC